MSRSMAKRRLAQLPEGVDPRWWIAGEIRHEEKPGIHTYHPCECKRKGCRGMMCADCWHEVLAQLPENDAQE